LTAGVPGTLDVNAGFLPVSRLRAGAVDVCRGDSQIPPAHYLCRAAAAPAVSRLLDGLGGPSSALVTRDRRQLGALVEQALRRRNPPGGRIGVLLSGGVDSALLVGCLASRMEADVETFTFRYAHYDGKFNEFEMAHEVAKQFRVPHHGLDYGPADVSDNIEQMVRSYGEPFIWGIHTFNLRRVVEAGVDTLLSAATAGRSEREDLIMRFRQLPAPLGGWLRQRYRRWP
jgi:asparagine synthetase B (glutamine-hydrolysing)